MTDLLPTASEFTGTHWKLLDYHCYFHREISACLLELQWKNKEDTLVLHHTHHHRCSGLQHSHIFHDWAQRSRFHPDKWNSQNRGDDQLCYICQTPHHFRPTTPISPHVQLPNIQENKSSFKHHLDQPKVTENKVVNPAIHISLIINP